MLVEPNSFFLSPPAGAIFVPVTYADEHDRVKHLHVLERLASELAQPVPEIKLLYEGILTKMQEVARIRDYLPILVSKRIKRAFKELRVGADDKLIQAADFN